MLAFGLSTHIAHRQTNQDRVLAKAEGTQGVFVVADGMGGLQDGHIAAEIAINAVSSWWENLRQGEDTPLTQLVQSINAEILDRAKDASSTMGTTFSMLYINGDTYDIAHVGDSRIYLVQNSLFYHRVKQLTTDHTWSADHAKTLSPQEISAHPKKNMLTSCLGVFDKPRIFTQSGKLKRGDYLLCSDGLFRSVNEKTMINASLRENGFAVFLQTVCRMQFPGIQKKDPQELATLLAETALSNGAQDNTSIVVVTVG